MRRLFEFSKVCMLALMCVLFLGLGLKAEAAPGTISKVVQTNADSTNIEVEWSNVTSGDAVKYKVEWCDNKNFTGTSYYYDTTQYNKAIISGFAAGKSYYVRVSAVDQDGMVGTPTKAIEVVTAPLAKVTGLTQTKAEEKKISMSWKKVSGANCYDVGYRKAGSSTKVKYKTVSSTSYKVALSADTKYEIYVYPMRKSSTGFIASGINRATMYMSTLPKKVTKVKMVSSGTSGNSQAPTATFSWSRSGAADGYEYMIYADGVKKPILSKTIKTNQNGVVARSSKLKNDRFMKIKVRAYIKYGKTVKRGPWSDFTYFAKYPKNVKASLVGTQASQGFKISWTKTKGADNYTVYVSRSQQTGYKKVGTTKGSSLVVKSFKGSAISTGRYYYYVVANKKVKGKTYKSDDNFCGGLTIYTTYY